METLSQERCQPLTGGLATVDGTDDTLVYAATVEKHNAPLIHWSQGTHKCSNKLYQGSFVMNNDSHSNSGSVPGGLIVGKSALF